MLECSCFTPRVGFGANTYVCSSLGEYMIIDPAVSPTEVCERLGDIRRSVKYIILTHCHFDHILTLSEWVEQTGVYPTLSPEAYRNIQSSDVNCYRLFSGKDIFYRDKAQTVADGDELTLGEVRLKILYTPGHTSGSISILADGYIFVGDTVFSHGSCGRCDLPTGNISLLRRSIQKLLSLDGGYKIMSGHGEPTTVSESKKYFNI